jgi:hypothetical protein
MITTTVTIITTDTATRISSYASLAELLQHHPWAFGDSFSLTGRTQEQQSREHSIG